MDFKEITAKSILVKSNVPGIDYVVNPYIGCRFGCKYCYASFMGRFNGKKISDWGNYVFAKTNAPELLEKRLKNIKNKGKGLTVWFSSVTDPYQGIEAKYKLTRQCLNRFYEAGFLGKISILTKSDLVLRDLDILKKLSDVEVGFTITTTDDKISRYFEKYAPEASSRLKALKEVNKAGIKTYAFVGPLLPHFTAEEKQLDNLFESIAETGCREIYAEHINLSNYILGRLKMETSGLDKTIITAFYTSKNAQYKSTLNKLVKKLAEKYSLKLRLGSAIDHKTYRVNRKKHTKILSSETVD